MSRRRRHRLGGATETDFDNYLKRMRARYLAHENATIDFRAELDAIYASADDLPWASSESVHPPSGPGVEIGGGPLEEVCQRIEMLEVLLETAQRPMTGPVLPDHYLRSCRRYLLRLRIGLRARTLSYPEAASLLSSVDHSLREANATLRHQHGLSLEDALRARIGELREIGDDLVTFVGDLRIQVRRLFDLSDDPVPKVPVPQG